MTQTDISKLISDRKKRVGDRISRLENTVRLIRKERTAQLNDFRLTFSQDVKLINTELAAIQAEFTQEMKTFNNELAEIRKELKGLEFDLVELEPSQKAS